MRRMFLALMVSAAYASQPVTAADDLTMSTAGFFRENVGANYLGYGGEYMSWLVDVTPNPGPLGDGDWNTQVSFTGFTDLANQTFTFDEGVYPMYYVGSPARPNEYYASILYDPSLLGSYELTASNPGSSNSPVTAPTQTMGFEAQSIPFPMSVSISGAGALPTFNWQLPTGINIDRVQTAILDLSDPNLIGARFIHLENHEPTTTSFTVPAVTSTGAVLNESTNYALRLALVDARDDGTTLSRSLSWFNFSLLPDNAPDNVVLPSVGPDGVYRFETEVVDGQTVFIDPDVAVGYDYEVGDGNPLFSSVLLPAVGDGLFDLLLFDSNDDPIDLAIEIMAGQEFDFTTALLAFAAELGFDPSSGVAKFGVRGIETGAGLDPNDPLAFITGLTFVGSGLFTGTMTPVVATVVPVPLPVALLCLPLGALAIRRYHT